MCFRHSIHVKIEELTLNIYLDRLDVLLDHLGGLAEAAVVDPPEQVVDGLGSGDDVEWRRHGSSVLEIRDPELAAGKLPLGVSLLLRSSHHHHHYLIH